MSFVLLEQKLKSYNVASSQGLQLATAEISQQVALLALSRSDFFKVAAFQGGTCLRIFYGLPRFSEDLDFVLLSQNKSFDFASYLHRMEEEFKAFGYDIDIKDRAKSNLAVQSVWIKHNSIGHLLDLSPRIKPDLKQKIQIKLEVDTNPPAGSLTELKQLDFPLPFKVQCQNLSSLFASKSHALLCRRYIKGRDWFDFWWYVSKKVTLNFELLSNAVNQIGPWKDKQVKVTKDWYLFEMSKRIKSIDWKQAKQDVTRFLPPSDLQSLDLWTPEFFLGCIESMRTTR